jgi:tRNA pseudouridine55 synthase
MDGLLVIDKPSGPTSHDVVLRMRRVVGERRIGHTGTLDPLATGVLPLVIGKATRLAQFLSASDKSYEAVVRLGVATDTADAGGEAITTRFEGTLPAREAIDRALEAFRGTFLQQPPAFSAKKIGGKRSYALARGENRRAVPALPARARVTVFRLDIVGIEADCVMLSLDCSAGFYVRSLAHDLGIALGTGAHLSSLRRIRSGRLTAADTITLATAEQDRNSAVAHIVPLARMLPELPSAVLTAEGVQRAIQGADIRPLDRESIEADFVDGGDDMRIRLLNSSGDLIAIAEPAGSDRHLHASVVLV